MDKSETPDQTEEGGTARRPRWVLTLGVLAAAGAVASLASLSAGSADTTAAAPSTVDVAAASEQSGLALPAPGAVSQLTGSVAGAAAPAQAAAPAVPDAATKVAPAAKPAAASTSAHTGMAPADTSSGSTSCVSKDVLQPIWAHIQSAHLETSPGQQVADALNIDQYVKTHTVWLEQVLAPLMNGSADQAVKDTLAPIWAHIQSAHLETSPGQQAADALQLDQYLKTHTVWLEQVLTPLVTQASC